MRHVWSVLCRSLLEDKSSGKSSLIDVTERIGFQGDPPDERPITLPFPFPLHLVSNWRRGHEDYKRKYPCRVRFISPAGDALRTYEFEVNLEEFPRMHTFGSFDDLPFTDSGTYEFEVAYKDSDDWKVVSRIPLDIVHEQPEPQNEDESDSTE